MKVTDVLENPTSTKPVKKVPELTIPLLRDPQEGNNSNGTDASCSSGGEEPELNEEDMNGSSNGVSSPPTPSDDIVNGPSPLENGASDKENLMPEHNGSAKRARSSSSNKRSRSNRNSEEKHSVKTTSNGANKSENEDGEEIAENDTAKEGDGKPEQQSDDVFYVHDAGLTIKIVAPAAEPFEIQSELSGDEMEDEDNERILVVIIDGKLDNDVSVTEELDDDDDDTLVEISDAELDAEKLVEIRDQELELDVDDTLIEINYQEQLEGDEIFGVVIEFNDELENCELHIKVSSSEIVQELHQLLMEREDTCHRTCFSLQLDGNTLDNFAELKSVAGLKDGSIIKVVEEPYTCREARIHVKHVRDLLKPSDWADAYAGTDCASLSFLNAVSGGDLSGKKRVVDCTPPDCIMPGTTNSLLLSPIHPLNKDQKPISCLKVLAASGWNPPPGYRKLHGDLMYILIVTLEDKTCHITASPRGFYLNRSTIEYFDPLPSHPNNFLSHSLIELLNQISTGFRKTFTQLQKRRMGRHPFERVATPYQVYSWVSPNISHNLDAIRAEEAFSSKLGYEEHIPGQTRDWNEELQSTRELPRTTLPERLLRERAIFKVHSDFVSAATRGAVAVIDGNIMAINPGESHKMQMYIWSNIFFSLGFDVRDHYKELGGDAAAHVAPRNDLQGVAAYNAIDLEGLYTLGTVVIDYRGYRVTAQSIIPGILEREQDQSVVYGSIDFGKTVVTNEKYLELLKKAACRLKVLPHYVSNEKNEVIELCSSVECKGIIGNDSRHYILDLLRTFPPDVNFLKGADIELSEDAKDLGYPLEHPHKLCCLRQELVDSFVESRYMTFIKVAAYHLQKYGFKAQMVNQISSLPIQENTVTEVPLLQIESSEPSIAISAVIDNQKVGEPSIVDGDSARSIPNEPNTDAKNDTEEEVTQETKVSTEINPTEESTTVRAIRNAATSVCSLSVTEFDLRFNPDIFSPSVKHAEPGEEQLNGIAVMEKDKKSQTAENNIGTDNSQIKGEGTETIPEVKDITKLKKYPSMEAQIRLNREACDFLLLFQIPTFIRDITANSACALDNGSTFLGPNALVMDGITLSAAMHVRGINIRYLGRVVFLLLERERTLKDSESRIVVIPTTSATSTSNSNSSAQIAPTSAQNLPHFMTTIGVTEIIARSTKHVFNPYVQSVDAMYQSLAISHFLNCFLMSGQPVPPVIGDELTPLKRGAHRNKNRQLSSNKGRQVNTNNGNSNGIEWTTMTQASLWEQIKQDMQSYYGFTLPDNAQESIDTCMSTYGIQRISLLRSFSLKTGVQILLREYQFNKSGMSTKSGGTSSTFTQEDILNVFPVVKHIDPKASDAYTFLNTAQSKMSSGFVREGYELLSESLNLLNNVYGAMHPDIALCLRSLARLNYVMGEYGDAMAYQQKALFMAERLLGIDHPTTILEYTHLSLYCFANNQVTTALKLLYRARYLSLLVCGENHPHVALLDSNIGLILHAVGEYELSLKFLEKALDLNKKYFGSRSLKTAVGHHLVARTQSCIGDFRSALMNERETYSIYREQLGDKHEKTQEAFDCLAHLTQQAVVLQRKINDMAHGKGLPPIQIQPPSMGSVLDMLNLINGILFMQISQQDIEIIKAEFEQRAREKRDVSE